MRKMLSFIGLVTLVLVVVPQVSAQTTIPLSTDIPDLTTTPTASPTNTPTPTPNTTQTPTPTPSPTSKAATAAPTATPKAATPRPAVKATTTTTTVAGPTADPSQTTRTVADLAPDTQPLPSFSFDLATRQNEVAASQSNAKKIALALVILLVVGLFGFLAKAGKLRLPRRTR